MPSRGARAVSRRLRCAVCAESRAHGYRDLTAIEGAEAHPPTRPASISHTRAAPSANRCAHADQSDPDISLLDADALAGLHSPDALAVFNFDA